MKKKFLISTGGSGGHVIPAISFYDHLKENFDVFLVLDKNHFQSVGGFDSDFFVYYEDVFLFDNLNLRYAKMKYYDSISISHIGGESLKNSFAYSQDLIIDFIVLKVYSIFGSSKILCLF